MDSAKVGTLTLEALHHAWFDLLVRRLLCAVFGHTEALSWTRSYEVSAALMGDGRVLGPHTAEERGIACLSCFRVVRIETDRNEADEVPS